MYVPNRKINPIYLWFKLGFAEIKDNELPLINRQIDDQMAPTLFQVEYTNKKYVYIIELVISPIY